MSSSKNLFSNIQFYYVEKEKDEISLTSNFISEYKKLFPESAQIESIEDDPILCHIPFLSEITGTRVDLPKCDFDLKVADSASPYQRFADAQLTMTQEVVAAIKGLSNRVVISHGEKVAVHLLNTFSERLYSAIDSDQARYKEAFQAYSDSKFGYKKLPLTQVDKFTEWQSTSVAFMMANARYASASAIRTSVDALCELSKTSLNLGTEERQSIQDETDKLLLDVDNVREVHREDLEAAQRALVADDSLTEDRKKYSLRDILDPHTAEAIQECDEEGNLGPNASSYADRAVPGPSDKATEIKSEEDTWTTVQGRTKRSVRSRSHRNSRRTPRNPKTSRDYDFSTQDQQTGQSENSRDYLTGLDEQKNTSRGGQQVRAEQPSLIPSKLGTPTTYTEPEGDESTRESSGRITNLQGRRAATYAEVAKQSSQKSGD